MLLRYALTVTMPAAVVWLLFAAPLGEGCGAGLAPSAYGFAGSQRVRQSDNQEASSTMIKIIHG